MMVHIKNTYCFMCDDLPLNQHHKSFDIWIQHVKTVGKHSLSVIHVLTDQKLISKQQFEYYEK